MARIKLIVNGAKGKMGQETVKAVQKESDLDLVAQLDLGDNLTEAIRKHGAEVVVDFTHPEAVVANVRTILTAGAHAVVGTTGISKDDLAEIEKLCEKN